MKRIMSKIDVLAVRPGETPEMIELEDDLRAMQDFVGGNIEAVRPWSDDVIIICDEEAALKQTPPNRIIKHPSGDVCCVICGAFFLCLAPRNSEVFMSLPRMMADRCIPLMVAPARSVEVCDE